MRLLILQKYVDGCKTAADAEGNEESNNVVDKYALCIQFAGFAIVLRIAVLAFDVVEHFGSKCAAPPCIFDGLCIGLSALGAGGILSWGLHVNSPVLICA